MTKVYSGQGIMSYKVILSHLTFTSVPRTICYISGTAYENIFVTPRIPRSSVRPKMGTSPVMRKSRRRRSVRWVGIELQISVLTLKKLDLFHSMEVLFPKHLQSISWESPYRGHHFHTIELDQTMETMDFLTKIPNVQNSFERCNFFIKMMVLVRNNVH